MNVTKIEFEIQQIYNKEIENMLPKKSKHIYEKANNRFKNWCAEKGVNVSTEEVMVAYFSHRSEQVKPSSIWSEYSMIRAVILLREIAKFF